MSKLRKIRGSGKGVVITVWVSESTKAHLQSIANSRGIKLSALAREILEKASSPVIDTHNG